MTTCFHTFFVSWQVLAPDVCSTCLKNFLLLVPLLASLSIIVWARITAPYLAIIDDNLQPAAKARATSIHQVTAPHLARIKVDRAFAMLGSAHFAKSHLFAFVEP